MENKNSLMNSWVSSPRQRLSFLSGKGQKKNAGFGNEEIWLTTVRLYYLTELTASCNKSFLSHKILLREISQLSVHSLCILKMWMLKT